MILDGHPIEEGESLSLWLYSPQTHYNLPHPKDGLVHVRLPFMVISLVRQNWTIIHHYEIETFEVITAMPDRRVGDVRERVTWDDAPRGGVKRDTKLVSSQLTTPILDFSLVYQWHTPEMGDERLKPVYPPNHAKIFTDALHRAINEGVYGDGA